MHPCSSSLLVFCCLPPQSALWSGTEQLRSTLERDGARSRADERPTSETATSPSFRCTYRLEEGDWEELVGPEGAGHSRP
jgi:hypothetical protein